MVFLDFKIRNKYKIWYNAQKLCINKFYESFTDIFHLKPIKRYICNAVKVKPREAPTIT